MSSDENQSKKVIFVFDPEFGNQIKDLPPSATIFVRESAKNDYATKGLKAKITAFPVDPQRGPFGTMMHLLLERTPPWSEFEVYGLPLDEKTERSLKNRFQAKAFQPIGTGFTCQRNFAASLSRAENALRWLAVGWCLMIVVAVFLELLGMHPAKGPHAPTSATEIAVLLIYAACAIGIYLMHPVGPMAFIAGFLLLQPALATHEFGYGLLFVPAILLRAFLRLRRY